MYQNLEEPIEHLRLLSVLPWRADVVLRREKVFLEDGRDGCTRFEHDAVKVVEIGVVIATH